MGVCGEERSKHCLPTSLSSPERSLVNKKVQKKKNVEISAGQEREGEAGEDKEFGEKRKRSLLRKTLFCPVVKPEENRENDGCGEWELNLLNVDDLTEKKDTRVEVLIS